MNSLSLLIYLAQVIENLSITLGILLIIFGLLSVMWIIAYCAAFNEDKEFKRGVMKTRFIPITASILAFMLVFIPSKQTIYLIAASEMGEQVITNPKSEEVFNKLYTIVNKELDKYIDNNLKNKDQ